MNQRQKLIEFDNADPSGGLGTTPNPSDTIRRGDDLLAAADEAIRRTLSGNSEQFLRSNIQQGGQ